MLQGRIWSQAEIGKKFSPSGIRLHNCPARCATSVKQTHKHTPPASSGNLQSRMLDLLSQQPNPFGKSCTPRWEAAAPYAPPPGSPPAVLCWTEGLVFRPLQVCNPHFVGDVKLGLTRYTPTHACTHIFERVFCKLKFPFPGLYFSSHTTWSPYAFPEHQNAVYS